MHNNQKNTLVNFGDKNSFKNLCFTHQLQISLERG